MADTTYRIIRQPDSTYYVEITIPNAVSRRSIRRGASDFKSEADAEEWISQHKRIEGNA